MPKITPPLSPLSANHKKVTVLTLRQMKQRGDPITMLTAYDYPTAHALEKVKVDAILVGDSLVSVEYAVGRCNVIDRICIGGLQRAGRM